MNAIQLNKLRYGMVAQHNPNLSVDKGESFAENHPTIIVAYDVK